MQHVDEGLDMFAETPTRDMALLPGGDAADSTHNKERPRSLPRIDVTVENVPRVAAEAWAALRVVGSACPQFVRVGNMACVRTSDGLEALNPATLTYWLARVTVIYKTTRNGDKV